MYLNRELKFSKYNLMPSLYITLLIIFLYNPFVSNGINHIYNREVGASTVRNVDIGTILGKFYGLYLVVLPGVFFLVYIFVNWVDTRINRRVIIDSDMQKCTTAFSIATTFILLLDFINYFGKGGVSPNIGLFVYLLAIIVSLYLYGFIRDGSHICVSDLKWVVAISINSVFFLQILTHTTRGNLIVPLIYEGCFALYCFILNSSKNAEKCKESFVLMSFYIVCIAVVLEAIATLNQHNIVVGNVKVILIVVFLVLIFGSMVQWSCKRKCNYDEVVNWGILLSVVFMAGLPKFQQVVETDLFEQANSGVPVSQLILFNKIPIVESISAHLGTDWIPNILYYIFNRDYVGALFSPYYEFWSIAWMLVLYAILKYCINKDYALLICLFIPFFSNGDMWTCLCLISICALVKINNLNWKNTIIFWFLLAVSVMYRTDAGIAMGIGSVLAYLVLKLLKMQKIKWKEITGSFLIVSGICILSFAVVCAIKDISMIDRATEFLDIFGASNQLWAYGEFGNNYSMQFAFIYFVMPIAVIAFLIYYMYILKKNLESVASIYSMITLAFGFSYIVNMQRILVRHNFIERGFSSSLIFTAGIFIALVLNARFKKTEYMMCFCVLGLLTVFFNIDDASLGNTNLITSAYDRFDNGNVITEYNVEEKVNRVEISANMQAIYLEIADEIDFLLEEDETFFDFSNQSLLYSLTQRECPVYVAQSPSFLSTERTQEYFIDELGHYQVPIAISTINGELNCGVGLDGVLHSYRSYLVSEYLNKNYTPVETVGSFVVWVKNDREDIKEKIESNYNNVEIGDLTLQNDVEVSKTTGGFKIKAGNVDPYIGDIPITSEETDEKVTVSISYRSDMSGNLQLFYKESLEEGYSEERSLIVETTYEGVASFTLNGQEAKYIRLDFPGNSQFDIVDVKCAAGERILSGYDYGQWETLHCHNLGAIPYLWGTYDFKEAYNNDLLQECELIGDNLYSVQDTEDSAYLAVTISSNEDTSATVLLGELGDLYSSKIQFSCTVYAGEFTYLFRVSADPYWYEGNIDTLLINTPENCTVEKVQLLQGDGYGD